ncbi:transglycosylase domain-containing protein [Marinobacterium rhizophilum]|uniref:transglycosylase domain-containing protein n=1 Tax=Marinobacterium rhizophilum TaxID=420402 RepID=UPI00035E4E85|nr:transglycosylase domain-containing protein [Marinobacterium rhizophilum]
MWVSPLVTIAAVAGLLAVHEIRTAELQSSELSRYAQTLQYTLQPGPSDAILYPQHGPFDLRMGYARLPSLLDRAQLRNFEILQQTRFSQPLLNYGQRGLPLPYPEKSQVGLEIRDCRREPLYDFAYPQQHYSSFAAIPPLVVHSLLFIENRDLLDPAQPRANPAVDWPRFVKAALSQLGKRLDLAGNSAGGSTLATQLEKYRHSPGGLTSSPNEKLRQMLSASVRAYQQGPDTLEWRQRVVRDYLNTVPLSAAPGHGEVHGLAAGLTAWFNADFDRLNQLLGSANAAEPADATTLAARGQALRQVLSLLIAQRRPSYYLNRGRSDLATLTDSHIRLLAQAGLIDDTLRRVALEQRVEFRNWIDNPIQHQIDSSKGINVARNRLSSLLGLPLYDLDRLDLAANSTLSGQLQRDVSQYLRRLADPDFATETGLLGERLLSASNTAQVRYSFTLFERSTDGNRVRVQTDNTDQPFDINEGSKLELGSTAKLRVLAHYLGVIAELHQRFSGLSRTELLALDITANDYLTRWARDYLARGNDPALEAMLEAAMERRYSASPYERFFTGGGLHTFSNFRREDNGRQATVREAVQESLNLPFVRLMRDLVRYSTYQAPGNAAELLKDDKDPRREDYLRRFADKEGKVFLLRFWRKYRNKTPQEQLDIFLDGLRQTPVRLAAVHRYLMPDASQAEFDTFLRERLPGEELTEKELTGLYSKYGPGAFNLTDQGYIARVHPLELWLLRYRLEHPIATFVDTVSASETQRQDVYRWLFRTRHKSARDSRIRTMLEVEAFLDIHERWQRLGYPFEHLVPSLATALGSSGDRPAALAELMGIIMNDGLRLPSVRIEQMDFATDTPYETHLGHRASGGVQVMQPEVARVLRKALNSVVEGGTARRLRGTFNDNLGTALDIGGKTGTGDNRIEQVGRGGQVLHSRVLNRTATFVFYLGPNHFGTLTAFVPGSDAKDFNFTSSLPVQVLKGMAPILQPYLQPGSRCLPEAAPLQQASVN